MGWLAACANRRQTGSATVEYVVVCFFVLVALLAGPQVIHMVMAALKEVYAAFYYAISVAA